MHDTICIYPTKCHFVNEPVSPQAEAGEAGRRPTPLKLRRIPLGLVWPLSVA